jgi:nicotinamidase-related amidase
MNTLDSQDFLNYLEPWVANLPEISLSEVVVHPERAAILSVDIINGFCYEGPLASPRVARVVEPTAQLFKAAWSYGIHNIVLIQDTHEPDAVEFGAWPAHCIRGTSEAETVAAFKTLPFFDQILKLEKNSISSQLHTGLVEWLAAHPEIDTFFAVGDCTDLCTYQLAMQLRLEANSTQLKRRVIVPANCVDTYDLPVKVSQIIGAMPHPGDLLHAIFLYHMAVNGIEVVAKIAAL